MFIDELARAEAIPVGRLQENAACGRGRLCGKKVVLAKPMTFMNNSGECVGKLARFYQVCAGKGCGEGDEVGEETGAAWRRERCSAVCVCVPWPPTGGSAAAAAAAQALRKQQPAGMKHRHSDVTPPLPLPLPLPRPQHTSNTHPDPGGAHPRRLRRPRPPLGAGAAARQGRARRAQRHAQHRGAPPGLQGLSPPAHRHRPPRGRDAHRQLRAAGAAPGGGGGEGRGCRAVPGL